MKNKAKISVHLQYFCAFVETQFDRKVKVIKSHNGKGFEMKRFYVEKGILHQTFYMETPEQNGRIERNHQHILNIARVLKFQSGLDIRYWSDFISTVIYLINRIPTPVLNNKTPFKIL